jgi:hypothetical protein
MAHFANNLDFKEGDFVYRLPDLKRNKEKKYKVHKIEYEEGGSYYDGFEVKFFAYLEDPETQLVERIQVAFFSPLNRIKDISTYKVKQYKED